jgi:hypothetical protein
MWGGTVLRRAGLSAVVVLGCASPLLAQHVEAPPPPTTFYEVLTRIDTGTVAVVLIFGTGMLAVLGSIVPGIVRAIRGEVHTAEEFEQRIAQLEHRLASLEQQTIAR